MGTTLQSVRFRRNDRVSQTFDLTFDLSAHDMFVARQSGAACGPSQSNDQTRAFLNDSGLTVWFSVPSTAVSAPPRRAKPGLYPHLRLSLFCGEAQWSMLSAIGLVAELNRYLWPTELTIAVPLSVEQPDIA
jgi:non-ribosomal peptide synthetase component F